MRNLDDESEAELDSCSCRSGADIVVATPGRLVAHLQGTPGFSLADLQFLVCFPSLTVVESSRTGPHRGL